MATTSTSWGLGAAQHKMTADISAPTPVANPSAESPIKAKSFSVLESSATKEPKAPASPVLPSSPNLPASPKETTTSSPPGGGPESPEQTSRLPTVSSSPNSEPEDKPVAENGNGVTAEAAAEAASAVRAAAATAVAKLSVTTNGVAKTTELDVVALAKNEAEMEDPGSDVAGTSSESGGEDDEERGGSSSAPGREEGQAGGAEALQTNGQQHGPVLSTVSAGVSAGNGQGSSPRQETDEHAARASDAATAALMAALASATRDPQPPPSRPTAVAKATSPKRSSIVSPVSKSPKLGHKSGMAAGAGGVKATTPARSSSGGDSVPLMFFSQLPEGGLEGEGEDLDDLVSRAMNSARYAWPRPDSLPELPGAAAGIDVDAGEDGNADVEEDLPPPVDLPVAPIPCMVGQFRIGEAVGTHRCVGTWAMNKADLIAAEKVEARASPFEFKASRVPNSDVPLSFPHSGAYQGHFLVRQGPRPVLKVDENELQIHFAKNSEGSWNVEGKGHNMYGSFSITGRLGTDRRLEVYRTYAPVPKKSSSARSGGHRRANSISSAEAAGGGAQQAPPAHALYGRTPGRGKHPREEPPAASSYSASPPGAPGLSNGVAGGEWATDGVGVAKVDTVTAAVAAAPTMPVGGRRVIRTPSYLIKDIGSEGAAHLSQGLRKCATLLKSLMAVPRKSEWFKEPVDHVRLQLVDYTRVIKRPMDLGTVRKKLEGGQYQNSEEFAADVRLVFSNARLYNSDPNSDVHIAARELYELFESKFQALGSGLDDPPSKRKKGSRKDGGSAFGSGGSVGANHTAAAVPALPPQPSIPPPDSDPNSDADNYFSESEQDFQSPPPAQPAKDKKRKSWAGAGPAAGGTGAIGGGSANKKPRPASESKKTKAEKGEPKKTKKQLAAEKKARAASLSESGDANTGVSQDGETSGSMELDSAGGEESVMVAMQRRMAEMEATIMLLASQQGQGSGQDLLPPTDVKKPTGAKGPGRKKQSTPKAAGTPKAGAKSKAAAGGKTKAAKTPKTPKPKTPKGQGRGGSAAAQAKAAAARAKAEAEAAAAQAALVPLTFDEKKALSVAINELDQNNLTRVVEIIQARMPLGSSDEEIELDIDAMDNLTLRDLQKFIMDVTAVGGSRSRNGSGSRGAGASDSESDGDAW